MVKIDKRKALLYIALIIIVGAIVGVVAYYGYTTAPAPAPAPPKPPIRIGGINILSGPHGCIFGHDAWNAAEMAAEEINAKGGILGRKIELKWMDDELKPETAVKHARYLVIEWGADFLVGLDSSACAMAVAEILPELDRVLIVCHAATHRLTEEVVWSKGNRYVFRLIQPTYLEGILPALYFADKTRFPTLRRWAGINPDYEYGVMSWSMFAWKLKELRPEVEFVHVSWPPLGTTDFTPHLTAALAAEPDGIYMSLWGGEAIMASKQALLLGIFDNPKIQAFHIAKGGAPFILEGLEKEFKEDAFRGKWSTGSKGWRLQNPEVASWAERFYKKFGRWPSYTSMCAYDAIYLIKDAVEKTGTTASKEIIRAIEGMTIKYCGITRYIRPEDHQAVYASPAGRVVWDPKIGYFNFDPMFMPPPEQWYRSPPFAPIPIHR